MANGKNCFIQTVKLPHVRGRVRYISDPKRQENLYAAYTSADPKFWRVPVKGESGGFCQKRDGREMYRGQGTDHHAAARPDPIMIMIRC